MAEKVYGCFSSEEAVVHAVSNLELKGYKSKNITIFTNLRNPNQLQQHTDVKVESNTAQPMQEASFMDKIKKVFLHDTEEDMSMSEKLTNHGIPEEEVAQCLADIDAGYAVVITDDTLRMGHAPPAVPVNKVK